MFITKISDDDDDDDEWWYILRLTRWTWNNYISLIKYYEVYVSETEYNLSVESNHIVESKAAESKREKNMESKNIHRLRLVICACFKLWMRYTSMALNEWMNEWPFMSGVTRRPMTFWWHKFELTFWSIMLPAGMFMGTWLGVSHVTSVRGDVVYFIDDSRRQRSPFITVATRPHTTNNKDTATRHSACRCL